jgi:imidazole glycerol phosphate synthase glutamine amidotransferase subunit
MKKICILDYGLGNIKSLHNSLKKVGQKPEFHSESNSKNFDIVFIPGVGSFSKASKLLLDIKFKEFLDNAKKNSYIFGICLGMQILLSNGDENGTHPGLDFVRGSVKLITNNKKKLILPIVGYQNINIKNSKDNYLDKFNNEKFYFVHSHVANPKNNERILATTTSQGVEYCSAIIKDNIIGTQFHPEKSGKIGLEFIKEFISNS